MIALFLLAASLLAADKTINDGFGDLVSVPAGAFKIRGGLTYFDDLSRHLMWEIYKRDFQLFKYDFDNPGNKMPLGPVDLDEVHAKLGE